jgi:hypothetical protein
VLALRNMNTTHFSECLAAPRNIGLPTTRYFFAIYHLLPRE